MCKNCGLHNAAGLCCRPVVRRVDARHVARAANLFSLVLVASAPTAGEHGSDEARVRRRAADRARLEILRQGLDPADLHTVDDCLRAMEGRAWLRH